jgi:hypothetical protein
MFKLTDEEIDDLQRFRNHCDATIEYIDEYLGKNSKGVHDKDLLYWIHAENTRGIEVRADYNIMHNELRTIQELEKRYSEYENNL